MPLLEGTVHSFDGLLDSKRFAVHVTGTSATTQTYRYKKCALHCRHAAQALDNKASSATMDAAMAKRFATDACFKVADDALQLHGGYGYLKDYPVERVLRDLRVHSILEGTNEVMRVIIAREMQKQQAAKS